MQGSRYKQEYPELCHRLALIGLTTAQMAIALGISDSCLNKWMARYPELKARIADGRAIADADIVVALRKRAIGYSYEEKTFEDKDGEMKLVKIVTKHIPPETAAIMSWLNNRQPEYWRNNRKEPVSAGTESFTLDLPKFETNES